MVEQKPSKEMYFFELCFALYATWYFLPIARGFFFGGMWNLLFFGVFIMSIAFALLKNLRFEMKDRTRRAAVPIILYMLVFLVYCYLDISYANDHIRVSFTFWGTFFFFLLSEKYPKSQIRLAKYVMLLYLVTYVTTFFFLATDPSIARLLTDASVELDTRRDVMMKNVGDIYVVQMSVMFIPFIMDVLLFRAKKWYYKFAGILVLVLELYFLISASFTISLIVYIVAIILSIIFLSNNKDSVDIVIKIGLIGLFVLVLVNMDWANIFNNIANSISNETIAQRFKGLEAMFTTGLESSDASSRPLLYKMSFNTFLNHLLGVGPNYSYVPGHQGIGMHSQILDDLARYGLLALGFYCMLFKRYFQLLYSSYKEVGREKVVLPTLLVYILFLIVNIGFRSPYESLIVLFVFPALPYVLSKKENNETESKEETKQ